MAALVMQKPTPKMGKAMAKLYPLFGAGAPVVFWAEGGMVRSKDERPETPIERRDRLIPWREMAHRVLVYSQMLVPDPNWRFERQRAQRWICEMEDVLREAAEQAEDPDGHKSLRQVADEQDRPLPPAKAASGDRRMEELGLAGRPKLVLPDQDFSF